MLARSTGDDKGLDEALSRARSITLAADASPIDRLARVRLEAIAIQTQKTPEKLEGQVKSLIGQVKEIVADPDLAPGRITRLSQVLEQTQRALGRAIAPGCQARSSRGGNPLADAIEVELEGIFQKGLSTSQKSDLQVYMTYAEHLRFRAAARALPSGGQRGVAAARRRDAVEFHVGDGDARGGRRDGPVEAERPQAIRDGRGAHPGPARFHRAQVPGPGTPVPGGRRARAIRPGSNRGQDDKRGQADADQPASPKLRAKALGHLKQAAILLPTMAEAQARYGVALVLNQEQSLGRQYLQNALRMGNLEPQYQFWAAWTILQAGYPEEAEPILDSLYRQLAQGTIPPNSPERSTS